MLYRKIMFVGAASAFMLSGCGSGSTEETVENTTTTPIENSTATLPASYTENDGRLLASSCFQCHGTNGQSTNSWDSLSADEMNEMIGEHPLMDAIGIGYTQSEILAMTGWLSTVSYSSDDENEGDDDD